MKSKFRQFVDRITFANGQNDSGQSAFLEAMPIENADKIKAPVQFEGRGSSGIKNFAGYISEEYLKNLQGHVAADTYDKMRRSDSKIKKVLKAVKDPIKAANWEIQAADDSTQSKLHQEFIKHVYFDGLEDDYNFQQHIGEAMTILEFGHAVFEKIHKVVVGDPIYGNYIGLKKLAWRSPRTIHKFNIDPKTEDLKSVTQYAYGDAARLVDIEAKFLMIITIDREGSNWEGISYLRNCYGAWSRKQMYLKLLAIGLEKYAIPTPIGNVPVTSGPDYDAFIQALEKYTSHETNYITLPKGWTIDLKESSFDPQKVRVAIDGENMEIVDSFIANFLELAMGTSSGGSHALSEDMSAFFLSGITQIAQKVADAHNSKVIKDLINLKFGPQPKYPKMVVSGITDKAGEALANALSALVDSEIIIPDDSLEENVRRRYDLPQASMKGQRKPSQQQALPKPVGLSELQIKLAEKNAKNLISYGTDCLKQAFMDNLSVIGERLIKDVMNARDKLSNAKAVKAITKVEPIGSNGYKSAVKSELAKIAAAGIDSAKKDVPKAKNIKFADSPEFEALPQYIKDAISAQAELLVETQLSDLKKAVLFQYNSSIAGTESDALIESDMLNALYKYIDGASVSAAAGISSAQMINNSRFSFFSDPEVSDQVEAAQFVNGDPVSPICQDLAGRVFDLNDPESQRYLPPLHHNCKSYIMPILVGNLGNKEVTSLKPSRASLEKYITLGEKN